MIDIAAQALPHYPCYLSRAAQGEFTTIDKAQISVMDRGFIFGDGVYEVCTVYDGKPFRFEQHLARLARSLAELRIPNPHSPQEWMQLIEQLITINSIANNVEDMPATDHLSSKDCLIYLQITRGVALRDHVMPNEIVPTVFIMCSPLSVPSAAQRARGVACITADDFRWQKAHIKSTSLLGAVLSRQLSADVGATETVMFRDGYLSEAATSNVWVIKNGQVLGVPPDNLVLEGIRYGLIEEMCTARGIPFALRRISREEVFAADELLLSASTKEVLPITLLDGIKVGSGQPGPIYEVLYAAYQAAKIAA